MLNTGLESWCQPPLMGCCFDGLLFVGCFLQSNESSMLTAYEGNSRNQIKLMVSLNSVASLAYYNFAYK